MSSRFPDTVVCPHCGLSVAGKASTGATRSHSRKAVEAGKLDSPCAERSREGQEFLASQYRRAAIPRRREFWAGRDRPSTITAEGTAQPVRRAE